MRNYRVLGPVLPEVPPMVYRGAPPLRLQVAPNVIASPKKAYLFKIWVDISLVGNVLYV